MNLNNYNEKELEEIKVFMKTNDYKNTLIKQLEEEIKKALDNEKFDEIEAINEILQIVINDNDKKYSFYDSHMKKIFFLR